MKATVAKLKQLIKELEDSSSSEAVALADVLESAAEDRDVDLAIAICDTMQDWAKKSKLVLKGKLKGL